jgi:hypothetical protein
MQVKQPVQTLFLILVPMLATFLGQRFYLHFVPIKHLMVGPYLVHHLYVGLAIVIPAAFVLAFGVRNRLLATLTPVALGVGSAMVLDEAIYLITMEAGYIHPEDTSIFYRTPVSLWGAVILISLAVVLLLGLFTLRCRGQNRRG